MQRYVLRLFVTAGVVAALHFLIVLNVRAPISAQYWVHDLIVAKGDLLSRLDSPRIIFVGGSSTLFGIDAVAVEHALGKPAFNFGLNAGMHLDDLLDPVRQQARAGDIVVLSLEGELYSKQPTWNAQQVKDALAWNRPAIDGQPFLDRLAIMARAAGPQLDFDLVRAKLEQRFTPAKLAEREASLVPDAQLLVRFHATQGHATEFGYDMDNLDDRGDIQHTEANGKIYWGPTGPPIPPDGIAPEIASTLSRFLDEMAARKVRVLFAHTPYLIDGTPGPEWKKAEAAFSADLDRLGGKLIDQREELFFPREMFFNTRYHLNAEGRSIRTAKLIEDLQTALAQP